MEGQAKFAPQEGSLEFYKNGHGIVIKDKKYSICDKNGNLIEVIYEFLDCDYLKSAESGYFIGRFKESDFKQYEFYVNQDGQIIFKTVINETAPEETISEILTKA